MTSLRTISIVSSLVLVALSTIAHADRRSFVHTYEYATMPKGDLELEFYNTSKRASFDHDSPRSFESQIEVEYGITHRWDVSVYQVFSQSTNPEMPELSSGFGYDKTKLRTRYRFAERGELPVDVLLYFELQRKFGADEWALEPKLVLARDFGKATVSLNLIPELEIERELEVDPMTGETESEAEAEFEPGWALGVTYELSPRLKLGAEWFGAIHHPGSDNEVETWLGPSLSWGPSPKLWVAANGGFGLTDDSADFVARFILGLGI